MGSFCHLAISWGSRLDGLSFGEEGRGGQTRAEQLWCTAFIQHTSSHPCGEVLVGKGDGGFPPQLSPKRAVCVAAREEGKGVHARSFERLRSRGVNPCAAHLAEPALRQGLEVREAGELAPPRALVAANLGK